MWLGVVELITIGWMEFITLTGIGLRNVKGGQGGIQTIISCACLAFLVLPLQLVIGRLQPGRKCGLAHLARNFGRRCRALRAARLQTSGSSYFKYVISLRVISQVISVFKS
jgi:hypothetical protein